MGTRATRLLIRGGTLVEGTGAPSTPADLLVEGDRIAAVAAPAGRAPEADAVLDASGRVVCPGFIDIHSHGELVVTLPAAEQRALLDGRIRQGITTAIVGNCGLGVFPCPPAAVPPLRAVVSWMTPPAAAGWPGDRWRDLGSYLAELDRGGVWVNVGALQPHGPLRLEVAGLHRRLGDGETASRAAAVMRRRLEEALDAGAFGLSTGLIYPPGMFTPTEEIVALARALAGAGDAAFLASHIRGSSETLLPAVEELLRVGREAGVRVQHSHNEAVGEAHWHKIEQVLRLEEEARRSGVAVFYDMFPYSAAATTMLAIYPPWALEGGIERLLARLADPSARRAVGAAIDTVSPSWPPWTEDGWPHNLARAVGWERITIGSVGSAANRGLEGMSVAELGRARGRSPFDAISDLMIEEGGEVSQIIHGVSGEEGRDEGIERLLADPAGAVCTDADDFGKGKPHPAAYGTFPRVLGRYVRERRVLEMPEAVRKMTGLPAELLGLKDRGVARPGAFADLVVFDPGRVGSKATYAEPRVPACGVDHVLVNGVPLVRDGRPVTPESGPPGRVLRRPGGP